ncbi:gasdermin-E-like isoform X2 [Leuresthes tenuis]|uniref:gasdermin-E-like isoform X2 n=1 Tax=Leuresthes tenuis TaxID=355514 RepID=UPI003B500163
MEPEKKSFFFSFLQSSSAKAMFSKATANFVRQVDPEGSLIHVSRVNDSHKLVLMGLVVKRNRIWAWQRPKYQPTDFTLSDLLLGGNVLRPGVSETEFLTYKGTYSDEHSGKLDTEAAHISVSLEGRSTSKLQSCFGKLKKEELDVKKLLSDSDSRLVDMKHVLVKQLEKRAEVLAVVKERILTTSSCSVTLTKKQQCTFQGLLGLLGLLGSSGKVCVKDTNNIEVDSDVSLEIPSDTVIAYSILELEIKKNGHYDICLQPGTIGGFEEDSVSTSRSFIDSFDTVDGKSNGSLRKDLFPLAELPHSTRCALIKKLRESLKDRPALSYLQCVLEELCCGETVNTAFTKELPEILRKTIVLDLLELDGLPQYSQSDVPAPLKAAHLLVSAMEELSDETLRLLSESQSDFLAALDTLMNSFSGSREPLSIHSLPVLLQDNQTFQQAEKLLGSISVTLSRDADQLWIEAGDDAGVLPLVLSLSIHGLTLLCI